MPLTHGGEPPPNGNQYSHVVKPPRLERIATSSSSRTLRAAWSQRGSLRRQAV
jgi:hypothetical protein